MLVSLRLNTYKTIIVGLRLNSSKTMLVGLSLNSSKTIALPFRNRKLSQLNMIPLLSVVISRTWMPHTKDIPGETKHARDLKMLGHRIHLSRLVNVC